MLTHSLSVGGSRTQLAGWSTYTLLLWTLKAAMCTFYIRLTVRRRGKAVAWVVAHQARRTVSISDRGSTSASRSSSRAGWPFSSPSCWAASPSRRTGRSIPTRAVCFARKAPTRRASVGTKALTARTDSCQPAVSKIDIFVTVSLNVVTDAYLLTIPIPMLWGASLRPVKKAALIVLFSGGIFVMAAGILRCVLIVSVRNTSLAAPWVPPGGNSVSSAD